MPVFIKNEKGRSLRPFWSPVSQGLLLRIPLPILLAGMLASGCASAESGQPVERRLAPPAAVQCDRNQLTSFTGQVTGYRRQASELWLEISTDWDTVEQLTLEFGERDGQVVGLLLRGEPFRSSDWKLLELAPGELRPDMRATAWVCEDAAIPPLVDWQPKP